MALSRLKATAHLSAVRTFTDRENARDAFSSALANLESGRKNLKVLTYYGVGGIGKSRLLRHLCRMLEGREGLRVAIIDLGSPQFAAPYDLLLEIRRQLGFRCYLFEYALARVLSLSGRSIKDINRGVLSEDSLLYDFQEVATELADIVAPARLLRKLYDRLTDARRRYLSSLKEEFASIDKISDSDLGAYLPYYLATEVAKQARDNGLKIVLFLDTFEAVDKRSGFQGTKAAPDDCIKEFIGSAEVGLYVLGGRNYLRWADDNPEWLNYVEQHSLGRLTDTDAEYFLRSLPIDQPDVRAAIIRSSKGVPLYLDLCASTYLIRKSEGEEILPTDFRVHEREVVRCFLAHLDPEHQETLKVMSIVDAFDFGLFGDITRSFNIGFPLTLFQDFCKSSYAEGVDTARGFFRIHSIVRDYISDQASTDTLGTVLACLVKQLVDDVEATKLDHAVWVFDQALSMAERYKVSPAGGGLDQLISGALALIDAGWWLHIHGSLKRAKWLIAGPVLTPVAANVLLLRAYCLRKEGNLGEADATYVNVRDSADLLGSRRLLFAFHAAHTRHLLGHYTESIVIYREIASHKPHDPNDRMVCNLARRQSADVLMLWGRFAEALTIFTELQNEYMGNQLWQAETLRFRGHVNRFNFFCTEAEALYREALTGC
jgi:hypothetical protein